jgi:hypothetical protein
MISKDKPAISRKAARKLRECMACWADDVKAFRAKHRANVFRRTELLYAIPSALLNAIQEETPNLLTSQEAAFEQDWAKLCTRHHALGVFHGRPVTWSLLNRPGIPIFSEDQFRKLGWDRYIKLDDAQQALCACSDLLDPLCVRSIAYVGWLLTYPLFLTERDLLRDRWASAIKLLGEIPAYPVQAAEELSKSRRPRNGIDVFPAISADFNAFYERWLLQRMPTWDLPEPCGANLTGEQLPCDRPPLVSKFMINVPNTMRLPANSPLQKTLEDIQRHQTPEHLRPWLDVQDQKNSDGLRYGRFGNIFRLAFYRDTVLSGRYGNRIAGHVEELDESFAIFLHVGIDSVKKLRLQMAALRTPRA